MTVKTTIAATSAIDAHTSCLIANISQPVSPFARSMR